MRWPAVIMLVLMGGGVALWGATRGPSRACLDARAQQRLDADAICRSGGGGSGHGGSSYRGGYSGSSVSAVSTIAGGGFGATGAHAAGS